MVKSALYFIMGYLEFCSNCGNKNQFGAKDGNMRHYCLQCGTIHYENPKPTATLICAHENQLLLVKRAIEPGKGMWGLPGGFVERGETPEMGAERELLEETNLRGCIKKILGTCSHFNTVFGDILLIGMEVQVKEWSTLRPGDDAAEATLFPLEKLPTLAFPCHEKIVKRYIEQLKS